MRRWAWGISFALLAGCTSAERPLEFNLGAETVQLDWNRAIDASSVVVLDNIMEGLTTYGELSPGSPALPRPAPALSVSWAISDGGRTYQFRLRSGVVWSDGQPLVAQQFVDSWERLLRPDTRSANAYHLFDVEGARAYNEGSLKDFSRVGVRALAPDLLEVKLRRPVPYFLHLVAAASTFPLRKDLVEKFGDQWTAPENIVTLGAYTLNSWVQGDGIFLIANPTHRGGPPPITSINCRLVAEPLTAYALYENGALDILPRELPPSLLRRLQARPDFRAGPKLSMSYLLFNSRKPPFDRAVNRRAFIHALNRDRLAAPFQGAQTPTAGWIPPGLPGHDEKLGVATEERTSDLLRGRRVELQFGGADIWNVVFQEAQRQMSRNLGLEARVAHLDGRAYEELLAVLAQPRRGRPDSLPHILLLGWVADYPDPHSFMNVFTSSSESNYGGWSNAEYDRLVEEAVDTTDDQRRAQLYHRAQRILLEEEAVLMPLFYPSHQALVSADLNGVRLNVLDKWYFHHLSFRDQGWRGFGRSFFRRFGGGGEPGKS